MASTSKAFKRCVHPCPRYLTPDDTHDLCIFCLGEEHARDVLKGAICLHCEFFSMRKLRSRLSLFSRKEGQPSASRGSRPTVAEARRGMSSWGSQADLADELERGFPSCARRPRTRVSCWIMMMRSRLHHLIQRLVLCWVMPRKSRRCLRAKKLRLSPLNPPALCMMSCWRLWYAWGKKK